MAGGVGHTGGLTNPRPWRGRCRAGYSNTGGPPLPRKRAPLQKKVFSECPYEGAMVCPYFELLDACQVVMTFLEGMDDCKALQFDCAVS